MRRIVSVSGSRADYGLMEPVHRAISADTGFDLHLIVTGMHHEPAYAESLGKVRADKFGTLHDVVLPAAGDNGQALAQTIGHAIVAMAEALGRNRPDIVLLQGDRGEMLAAAIAAAHMNIAIVHMSGGDISGSIDDSVRHAISKLSHFHLTSSSASTKQLIALGETSARIVEVGEPALDLMRTIPVIPFETLAGELDLPTDRPFIMATLHPVSDDTESAGEQMRTMLEALAEFELPAIVTYPNSDAGGNAMRAVLESWRSRPFLRVVPSLGSHRYLSLMRYAAALVGNSSSGIIEAPTLKVPVVNIGSRQTGRLRSDNVFDVPCEREAIVNALRVVLQDSAFRRRLATCRNPYGDGRAAERVVDTLTRLKLGPVLTAKWLPWSGSFLTDATNGI